MPATKPERQPRSESAQWWWDTGRKATAMGTIISLCIWQAGVIVEESRLNRAAEMERHKDAMEAAKSNERHQSTQIELTRELTSAVKENTAEVRASRAVSERLEFVIGLGGWPFPKKGGLP